MDKSHVLGIDIGTATIKVFSGAIAGPDDVTINSIGLMPAAGFDKGAILDYHALADSVRQAVDCAISSDRLFDREVYIGIGGMGIKAFNCVGSVAPLSPKSVTKEDVDRVCRSAIVANIPEKLAVLHVLPLSFRVDNEIYNTEPLGQMGSCLEAEVHVVTVPEATINELISAVQSKGLSVKAVVANSVVCAQALITAEGKRNGMIIDIGAGTTEIAIYRDGSICHSASLPLGGNYITRDIMQALGISNEHAEGIKRYYSRLDKSLRGQAVTLDCNDYGTTDKQVSYDFLCDVIESRVEEIVFLIQEYVKGILVNNPADEVLVTGGCAAMPSFIEALEKCFSVPVITVIPKNLTAEYAHPSNSACYGILAHIAHTAVEIESESTTSPLKTLFQKIKRLF